MVEMVYWAEIQSALSSVGLKVVIDVPKPDDGPWSGKIDDRPFTMTISPKSEKDGFRDFLVLSLYGQEEKKVILLLSKFMGYKPFCKYLHKENSKASATYEWDRKDPNARLKELEVDPDVYKLQKLEKGFKNPRPKNVSKFFMQFTPKTLKIWEKAVQENSDVEWNFKKICDFLPFIKKVMPRISSNQSIFGLSIISLGGKTQEEEEIVRYGLEPLLRANILTKEEVELIINWYIHTKPTWESGGAGHFQKEFEIDKVKYRLITDSYRNCRDLNLQVLKS